MTYCCERCGFLFIRFGPVQRCPSCEQPDIRTATSEEAVRLHQQLEGSPLPKGERNKEPEKHGRDPCTHRRL